MNILRKLTAIIEIVGGVLGIAVSLPAMRNAGSASGTMLLILALYVLSLAAGIQLWRNRGSGLGLSFFVQLAQVPWVVSPQLTYRFVSGIGAFVSLTPGQWQTSATIGSSFHFAMTTGFGFQMQAAPSVLHVNLAAVLAVLCLVVIAKRRAAGAGERQQAAEQAA